MARDDAGYGGTERLGPALLELSAVSAAHGAKRVLENVSISVGAGETVALLGHNGAGKTTILRIAMGLHPRQSGDLTIDGVAVTGMHSPSVSRRRGFAMIPSERFVFPDLTVRDNLRFAAEGVVAADRARRVEDALSDFPILGERLDQLAGTMSGGQQRMVSLAMAMMGKPRLLLLDEPSLGLSPSVAEEVMRRVAREVSAGMSVLLVEQNVRLALSIASKTYVIRSGNIILETGPEELRSMGREKWWELF